MNEYDTKYDEKWEKQINALLDGELNDAEADELKSEATDDRELARALFDANARHRCLPAAGAPRLRISC